MTELRKGQVRLGPRTWAVIREAYLGGASGAALAEAYGCSLGTIRYRAVREGWRRCDVGEGAGPQEAAPVAPEQPLTTEGLHELALSAARRALVHGRPSEALAYIRVWEALGRLSADMPPATGPMSLITQEELDERREEMDARIQRIMETLALKQGRQATL